MTTIKRLAGIVAVTALFTWSVQAQTKNEAIEAYNEGVGLMKTDTQGAINAFEKSVQIAEQVGDSAADLKEKTIAILPDLYYQKAYKAYTNKDMAGAISASKETIAAADKYKNDKTKERAVTLLTQLYMVQGSNYFKNNQNNEAIAAFDSAMIVNPDNAKALLNKALVYRKLDDPDKFSATIDEFIEKGKSDAAQVDQAKKLAIDYFKAIGGKANQTKKYDDAIKALTQSTKYGEDKDVYYQLAMANNGKKNFDEAADFAQKGLALETGAADAKAKFYYELAVAQAGKGDKDNACANFKNAQYGPFATAAKAQQTNLKCATPAK